MRIISDFHDYYDVVMKQGQDMTLVFKRDGRSEEETTPPVPLLRSRYWSWHKLRPDSFIIGFCGKLYPGLRIPTYCTDDYKENFMAKKKEFPP
jgi:hypothetical protein